MRPPECAICGSDFEPGDKGGLVHFKKRFSDNVWIRKMKRINGVGHPPYAEWFCGKHIDRAKELSNLTVNKAMEIMKAEEEQKKKE